MYEICCFSHYVLEKALIIIFFFSWDIRYCFEYMQNMWASRVAVVVNNPLVNAGDTRDMSLITGSEISPGGEHGYPIQYSCQENPIDRGAIGLQRVKHN